MNALLLPWCWSYPSEDAALLPVAFCLFNLDCLPSVEGPVLFPWTTPFARTVCLWYQGFVPWWVFDVEYPQWVSWYRPSSLLSPYSPFFFVSLTYDLLFLLNAIERGGSPVGKKQPYFFETQNWFPWYTMGHEVLSTGKLKLHSKFSISKEFPKQDLPMMFLVCRLYEL
jgi:hypothetical protein